MASSHLLRQIGPAVKSQKGPYPVAQPGAPSQQLVASTAKLQPKLLKALQMAAQVHGGAKPSGMPVAGPGPIPPPSAGSAFAQAKMARNATSPPLGSGKIFR